MRSVTVRVTSPELLVVLVSPDTGVMSTWNRTLLEAVIPVGAGISKLSVSHSLPHCGETGAGMDPLTGVACAPKAIAVPLTETLNVPVTPAT